MTRTPSERGDPLVAQLFGEYLVAEEQGLDVASTLVERAGEQGEALARKIRIHCDLRALSTQIQAEATLFKPQTREVGAGLLGAARDFGADLLVMGAYSHSRLRQLILGGVTRHVLENADIAVQMCR